MGSLIDILLMLLGVARFFIIVHFIMSWLISFQVLNLHQQVVSQIWYALNRLLDPIYAPIRRILPDTRPLDLAPLVALLAIEAIRIIILNNAHAF